MLVINASRSRSWTWLVRGNLLYSVCEAMETPRPTAVREFAVHSLVKSPTSRDRGYGVPGNGCAMSAEEWTATTQLIFASRSLHEHFASSLLLSTSKPRSGDRHAQEEA